MDNKDKLNPDFLDEAIPSFDFLINEVEGEAEFKDLFVDDNCIPVLPLRDGIIPFPFLEVPVNVGRPSSVRLLEDALKNTSAVLVVSQKNVDVEAPGFKDIYHVGVIARVSRLVDMPGGDNKIAVLSLANTVNIEKIVKRKPYLCAKVTPRLEKYPVADDPEMDTLYRSVRDAFIGVLNMMGHPAKDNVKYQLDAFKYPMKQLNFIFYNAPVRLDDRQSLLEEADYKVRLARLLHMLDMARQLLELRNKIHLRTSEDLNEMQREQFLRQEIRNIQGELGENYEESDQAELERRAKEKKWSKEVENHFKKELKKIGRYSPNMPEYSIQYSYLEFLLNLPWDNVSSEDISLDKVESVLDRDHYGLEKVKERIIEHMAVLKLRKDMKAPIICLYGPPGVGKTSLGRSIADALGREYARISLGGLHDEAEIRGHRRTYIGAMAGRILSALAKCGTGNPVFVLDEIDKIGSDFKGDPAMALLEVLDPEQNSKFHDNYVDFDYDLSKVMFIATANNIGNISSPLQDRMEMIEIGGYIAEEKVEIAARHLVPKALKEHGFAEDEVTISREALRFIIDNYTRESGVRLLDKKIAQVLRKIARQKASGKEYPAEVDVEKVKEHLGNEEVISDVYENNDFAGVVTGLAWTPVGGEILFIESILSKGKGDKLVMTGNLGDVMKESATIAMSYVKSHAEELGIPGEMFNDYNVHLHVPEGAIPKDGPSAGITMTTSLASAFTGRKVKDKTAMTGEMTLRGKVLPVGGIREKILAAKRAGITDIILSSKNRKNVEEIKPEYLEGLTFHYVERIEEVLAIALLDEKAPY